MSIEIENAVLRRIALRPEATVAARIEGEYESATDRLQVAVTQLKRADLWYGPQVVYAAQEVVRAAQELEAVSRAAASNWAAGESNE